MNKVFLRARYHETMPGKGPMFSERLDITVDQEDKSFKRCFFSFRSQLNGIANIEGHVSFNDPYNNEPTGLNHTSGRVTMDTMTNFNALTALLSRLETLCASGMTDEQILSDSRVELILKNNNWKELTHEPSVK